VAIKHPKKEAPREEKREREEKKKPRPLGMK
jgi:hypothetical protein